MSSTGQTIAQVRQEPEAGPTSPCPGSPRIDADSRATPDRSRGPGAFHALAPWLRRALADSARAWALAAGVPPDLYD